MTHTTEIIFYSSTSTRIRMLLIRHLSMSLIVSSTPNINTSFSRDWILMPKFTWMANSSFQLTICSEHTKLVSHSKSPMNWLSISPHRPSTTSNSKAYSKTHMDLNCLLTIPLLGRLPISTGGIGDLEFYQWEFGRMWMCLFTMIRKCRICDLLIVS